MTDSKIPPLRLRARLYCGDEIAIGPGKADLLDAIVSMGSISAAGRALEMNFPRTWPLVDTMNGCWQEPVVTTPSGGSHGGGAALTPLGKTVLAQYRQLQQAIDKAARAPALQLAQSLATEPRPFARKPPESAGG